jgi:hypothetical protein
VTLCFADNSGQFLCSSEKIPPHVLEVLALLWWELNRGAKLEERGSAKTVEVAQGLVVRAMEEDEGTEL